MKLETKRAGDRVSIGGKMARLFRIAQVFVVAFATILVSFVGGAQLASAAPEVPVIASYNGGTLDMSHGWGSATVCDETVVGVYCFSSQAAYESWQSSAVGQSLVQPLTSCASSLDLYQNEGYGGDELILSSTLIWLNLSDYSFADEVSSYKVGSCSIIMTDGTNGSGDVYPGATSAGSDVSWIGAAWNDRVQSVYIN